MMAPVVRTGSDSEREFVRRWNACCSVEDLGLISVKATAGSVVYA
jgi:hypothetical protein